MSDSKIINRKDEFEKLCRQWVKRDGIEDLLDWLETTDFYSAPASTKYHCMYDGGLCDHSINVFNRMKNEAEAEGWFNGKTSDETQKTMEQIAIVALFHDVCKANFYKASERNVKNEYGIWVKEPYYSIDNKGILVGHGYKSARIVSRYIDISDEEYMAILHHMGYSAEDNIGHISEIFTKSELTLLLHIADTKATFIDENYNQFLSKEGE